MSHPQDTDRQTIWELYGHLLDYYHDQTFSARQLAYDLCQETKIINRILHRLIQHGAVLCTGKDHWGVKMYRLNESFNT